MDRPPALALGSGVTLLGVTRILGRQGLPRRASVSKGDLVAASRWLPKTAHLPPVGAAAGLAGYLEALPLATAELPAPLAERFPSYQPPASVLRLLTDKGAFLQTLKTLSLPHPCTLLVERPEDLERVPDAALETMFIKPRDSQRFHREVGLKGLRPGTREGFRAALTALFAAGHGLMLQEYVPGPASNHYFLDGFAGENGEVLALMVRRRLRMFPVDFGNSTFMVTVPSDEASDAAASLRNLLASLRYRGMFSAEFKRDDRDGTFRILEVNARPWWYVEFAARAGIDVVNLAYRAALGLPLDPPTRYRVGYTMIYPYYDYFACKTLMPGKVAAVRRFLVDLLHSDQPVFCWDDPNPALRHWARSAPSIIARRLPWRRHSTVR